MKKTFCYLMGFCYFVFTLALWIGLAVSLNGLPLDYVPDDNALCCFGIGLCALPAIILASGSVGFCIELFADFRSKDDQKNTGLS